INYVNGENVNYELGKIQSNEEGGQTNSCVIDHFVESIITNTEPLIDGVEGKNSLDVILAAVQSNETRKVKQLKAVWMRAAWEWATLFRGGTGRFQGETARFLAICRACASLLHWHATR